MLAYWTQTFQALGNKSYRDINGHAKLLLPKTYRAKSFCLCSKDHWWPIHRAFWSLRRADDLSSRLLILRFRRAGNRRLPENLSHGATEVPSSYIGPAQMASKRNSAVALVCLTYLLVLVTLHVYWKSITLLDFESIYSLAERFLVVTALWPNWQRFGPWIVPHRKSRFEPRVFCAPQHNSCIQGSDRAAPKFLRHAEGHTLSQIEVRYLIFFQRQIYALNIVQIRL